MIFSLIRGGNHTAYRVGKPLSPNALASLRDGKAIPWVTAIFM
jgi:hypothetical protein